MYMCVRGRVCSVIYMCAGVGYEQSCICVRGRV